MFDTEFLDIPALRSVSGTVRLPGSKSISNRVLLLAALCDGQTTVRDLLDVPAVHAIGYCVAGTTLAATLV